MHINLRAIFIVLLVLLATPSVASNWDNVKETIAEVSVLTGVPSTELAIVGYLESSFRPYVSSKKGTAVGLMQITKPTWEYLVYTYGGKYGITSEVLPTDPRANTILAAMYLKESRSIMERRLDRRISTVELYLGHKFGPYRATRLIMSPDDMLLLEFYPRAARNNYDVYYGEDGYPRTISEVKEFFGERVERAFDAYSASAMEEVVKYKRAQYDEFLTASLHTTPDCTFTPDTFAELLAIDRVSYNTVIVAERAHVNTHAVYVAYITYNGNDWPSGKRFKGFLV